MSLIFILDLSDCSASHKSSHFMAINTWQDLEAKKNLTKPKEDPTTDHLEPSDQHGWREFVTVRPAPLHTLPFRFLQITLAMLSDLHLVAGLAQ